MIAFLALDHFVFAVFFIENPSPLADALQNRDDGSSFLGQGILYFRRDLIVRFSVDDTIFNQVLQRCRKDGIGDIVHFFPDLAVTQSLSGRQYADNAGFPFAAKDC